MSQYTRGGEDDGGSSETGTGTNEEGNADDEDPDELRRWQPLRLPTAAAGAARGRRLPSQPRGRDWSEGDEEEDVHSRPGSPFVSAPAADADADASSSSQSQSPFPSRTPSSHDLLRRLSADGRLESTADEASSDAGADDGSSDPLRAHLLARRGQQRTQQKPRRATTTPTASTLVRLLDRGAGVGAGVSGASVATSSTDWSSSEDEEGTTTSTSTSAHHDDGEGMQRARTQEQQRRSYRISNMPARSFDEPRSVQEERRRAVLGDDAVDLRRGMRRLEVAGMGRRSEGSALRPQLEPHSTGMMRFGSPIVRALFRTAEQEIGPRRRPSVYPPGTVAAIVVEPNESADTQDGWTSIDLSDIEQSQLEQERQERHQKKEQKKKEKRKKSKKKRKKSSERKGKGKKPNDEPDEDEAQLIESSKQTSPVKAKQRSVDGRRRKSYIFPIEEATHMQEPAVPLHVWLYQLVINFLWPPLNYYRLHWLYICFCSIFGGLLIYLSQDDMSYTDALFLSTSAVTTCGLVTTNTAQVNRLGQFWVVVLMIVGNFVLLTLPPVLLRLYYFRKHFRTTGLRCKRRVAEYNALKWFAVIVPVYYAMWVGLASFFLSFYFSVSDSARDELRLYDNNPVWWAIFNSVSSFSNAGISITPNGMVAFQNYPFPLFVSSFLILAGYTAFPLLMRFIVWCLYRYNRLADSRPVFKYMLDHPRRCFTHLFPAAETRWLLLVFIFLNSVEFLFEIVLDWYSAAYDGFTPGLKLVNMYYQTISIRVAGFNSIDVNKLNLALLWLYTGMMYISATPVAIAVRYTGTSRAQEIGIKRGIPMNNTLAQQAQGLFIKHTIMLFVAVLFIVMIEEIPLTTDPDFSIFKIIFEVVSAYGPVGLSLGYGDKPYSFSGAFHDGSKLVIIFIMILGKHRGLPDSIDSAISLPSTMQPDLERGEDLPRASTERRRRPRYDNEDGGDRDDDRYGRKGRRHDRARDDSSDDESASKRVKHVAWALWDSFIGHDDHRRKANSDDEDPGLSAAPAHRHKPTGKSEDDSKQRVVEEWHDLLQPLKMSKDDSQHGLRVGEQRRSYDTLPLPSPEPPRQSSPPHKPKSDAYDHAPTMRHQHHRNSSLPAICQPPDLA